MPYFQIHMYITALWTHSNVHIYISCYGILITEADRRYLLRMCEGCWGQQESYMVLLKLGGYIKLVDGKD